MPALVAPGRLHDIYCMPSIAAHRVHSESVRTLCLGSTLANAFQMAREVRAVSEVLPLLMRVGPWRPPTRPSSARVSHDGCAHRLLRR
eukprot:3034689-Pyramimonas_sp.AAC.1